VLWKKPHHSLVRWLGEPDSPAFCGALAAVDAKMLARAQAMPVVSAKGVQPSRKNMSKGDRMITVLLRTSTTPSKRALNKAEVDGDELRATTSLSSTILANNIRLPLSSARPRSLRVRLPSIMARRNCRRLSVPAINNWPSAVAPPVPVTALLAKRTQGVAEKNVQDTLSAEGSTINSSRLLTRKPSVPPPD